MLSETREDGARWQQSIQKKVFMFLLLTRFGVFGFAGFRVCPGHRIFHILSMTLKNVLSMVRLCLSHIESMVWGLLFPHVSSIFLSAQGCLYGYTVIRIVMLQMIILLDVVILLSCLTTIRFTVAYCSVITPLSCIIGLLQ